MSGYISGSDQRIRRKDGKRRGRAEDTQIPDRKTSIAHQKSHGEDIKNSIILPAALTKRTQEDLQSQQSDLLRGSMLMHITERRESRLKNYQSHFSGPQFAHAHESFRSIIEQKRAVGVEVQERIGKLYERYR